MPHTMSMSEPKKRGRPLGSKNKPKLPGTTTPRTPIRKPKRKVAALAAPRTMPIAEDVIDLCVDSHEETGYAVDPQTLMRRRLAEAAEARIRAMQQRGQQGPVSKMKPSAPSNQFVFTGVSPLDWN